MGESYRAEFLKLAFTANIEGRECARSDDATEQYAEHLRRINQQTEEASGQREAPSWEPATYRTKDPDTPE